MAFNQIKGIEALGVVASVVGNERTVAAQAQLKAEAKARLANAPHKIAPTPKPVVDPWAAELARLGFGGDVCA